MTGIYKIEFISNPERIYIGSAVDINKRWSRHKTELKCEKHSNSKLQRHVIKYGIEDLKFTVLLECLKEDLIRNEQYFIDEYDPYFNILKIAGSQIGNKSIKGQVGPMFGRKHSEETKQKIRDKRALQKVTGGFKKGHIPWNKDIPMTEEIKEKVSKAKKGTAPWNKGKKSSRKRNKLGQFI